MDHGMPRCLLDLQSRRYCNVSAWCGRVQIARIRAMRPTVRWTRRGGVDRAQLEQMIRRGELADAMTLAALRLAGF